MEKITNEMRERIFWTYAPKEILWNDRVWSFAGFQGNTHVKLLRSDSCGYFMPFDKCTLLLHELKNITDEHAVEVARVYSSNVIDSVELNTWKVVRENIKGFMYVHVISGASTVAFNIDIAHRVIETYDTGEACPANSMLPCFDTLRSLGYDCGYGDIPSLIAAGIAKPINNKIEK